MEHNFKFFVKEGAGNMFSHGFMSFAAIGVTVACLLIMGTFTLVAYNANENLADLQQENAVVAFVYETLDEPEARALQAKVESTDNVADCQFVTRTEARDAYVEKYDDEDVYGDLDPTVFRHRFVIHVTDPDRIMETKAAVESIPGIAKARADEAVANGFTTVRNVAGVISIALIAILLLVSVFIISNTIKLTTFDRRDEIAIMKMVGATDGFILRPFLYGGAMLGFSGAFLSLILSEILVMRLSSAVTEVAKVFGTQFELSGLGFDECLLMLIVCSMIGWVAAWLATVQHLRHFTPD